MTKKNRRQKSKFNCLNPIKTILLLGLLFSISSCESPLPKQKKGSGSLKFRSNTSLRNQFKNGSANWQKVRPLLISKCLECHVGGEHNLNMSEEDLLNSDLVVRGYPELSLLWQRLKGVNLFRAIESMPEERDELNADEKRILYTWIKESSAVPTGDTAPPFITLSVLNLQGVRILENPLELYGVCESELLVEAEVERNGSVITSSMVCDNQGQYNLSITLPEYGYYNIAVKQVDPAGNESVRTTSVRYASPSATCTTNSPQFQNFKAALSEGTCFDCHGDNPQELYVDFRAYDFCEEDWMYSEYVSPANLENSSIYNKMHGSGLPHQNDVMPPFHSELSTEAQYQSVLAEMSGANSTIRSRTRDWIYSLDDATLSNLTYQINGNIVQFAVDKNYKVTREVRFDVYDANNNLVNSSVSGQSPYRGTFIPIANGNYTVRARAIEFNNNISSQVSQSFTISSLTSSDPRGAIPLNPGLHARYYDGIDFDTLLTVNSQNIVPQVNFNLPGAIHPEYPTVVDQWSMKIEGFIEIPQNAEYIFTAEIDDRVRLEIAGQVLINNQNNGAHTLSSNLIQLDAGVYPIKIDYRESTFSSNLRLFYQISNIGQRVLIPSTWFTYSPTIRNGTISIQEPQMGTYFKEVVPQISGSCIGGFPVIVTGDVETPVSVPCNSATNTFMFPNVSLSPGSGQKIISTNQNVFGFQFSAERTIYNDVTAPNLTFIDMPNSGSQVPNGIVIKGSCEYPGGPVILEGDLVSQSLSCNNNFSFIANFNPPSGPVQFTVSQEDLLGNKAEISLNYNLQAGVNTNQPQAQTPNFANSCQSGDPNDKSPSGMRTLTKRQFENTFRDLFSNYNFYQNFEQTAEAQLGFSLIENTKPERNLTSVDHFTRSVNAYSTTSQQGIENLVFSFINYIGDDENRIREIVGGNCYDNVNNNCLNSFLIDFLRKAYRRPATSTQINDRIALYNNSGNRVDGFKNIFLSTLLSPHFLYRLRLGQAANGFIEFDNYTIIEEISYRYLDRAPSSHLRSLANQATPFTEYQVNQIIDQIFTDPQYQNDLEEVIWNFFKEWLHIDYGNFLGYSPMAQAQTNNLITTLPTAMQYYDDLVDEAKDYVLHLVRTGGTYSDFFQGQNIYLRNSQLAGYYGFNEWDGNYNSVEQDPSRYGFFTLPAFLAQKGLGYANPFGRGGELYKQVFCGTFSATATPPPAPVVEITELKTNRQFFDDLVPNGSTCMDCHGAINGIGFAFEDRDFLGKPKNGIENIFDVQGVALGQLPVDSITMAPMGQSFVSVTGSNDLLDKAYQTEVPHACMAERYFNYFYGRSPASADSCKVNSLFETLKNSSSLKEFFKEAGKGGQALMRRKEI